MYRRYGGDTKLSVALVFAVVVAGCAAQGHLNTPSGHPQVTVPTVIRQAKHASLAWLMAHDWYVAGNVDTNEASLVAEKDVTSGFYKLTPGNQTLYRIVLTYLQDSDSSTTIFAKKSERTLRVQGRSQVSGYSELDSQEDYDELQQMLTEIAQQTPKK